MIVQGGKGACIYIQFQELGPRAEHAEEEAPHTNNDGLQKKLIDKRKKVAAQTSTSRPQKIPACRQDLDSDAMRSHAQFIRYSRDRMEEPTSQGPPQAHLATPLNLVLQPRTKGAQHVEVSRSGTAPPLQGCRKEARAPVQASCGSGGAGAEQSHASRHRDGGSGAHSWYGLT